MRKLYFLHKLACLSPKRNLVSLKNLATTRKQRALMRSDLKTFGFYSIHANEPHTWKLYKNGEFRITLKAKMNKKAFLVKCDSDMSRLLISVNFYKLFGSQFTFVPHGQVYSVNGNQYLATEYIKHTTFLESKNYIKKHLSEYLEQALNILHSFDKFKIIHCDLGEYNLIFQRKTKKMFLIDFDTWHSDLFPLEGARKPPRKNVYVESGLSVFDDAYCFVKIFTQLKVRDIEKNSVFKSITELIGKNVYKW